MKATYIAHMGSDLMVVNSARVSFAKESALEEDGRLPKQDSRLISYLAKHGHWTPFSHPQITMREDVPIFVARQRFKHMVGFTYNEVSRRYVDDAPEFFVPSVWRSRPEGSVKQGSSCTRSVRRLPETDRHFEQDTKGAYAELIDHASALYESMIGAGVAPEQARMVLPQSMFTSYYVTGSLAAWARAYKQRIDPHAQVEIQELAQQWGEIIQPLFPSSWAALTEG
jgi:thymidylate synthase (FAD)